MKPKPLAALLPRIPAVPFALSLGLSGCGDSSSASGTEKEKEKEKPSPEVSPKSEPAGAPLKIAYSHWPGWVAPLGDLKIGERYLSSLGVVFGGFLLAAGVGLPPAL